jgi:hypothetical protein
MLLLVLLHHSLEAHRLPLPSSLSLFSLERTERHGRLV